MRISLSRLQLFLLQARVCLAALAALPTATSATGAPVQQAYVKASNPGTFDQFGCAAAISGDTMVVGAWTEGSNATGVNGDQTNDNARSSGAAYVFVRSGTNWVQQAYLKASNTEGEFPRNSGTGDYFGWAVAISGDTAVVGAIGEDSAATGVNGDQIDNSVRDAGAAYVFVRNGTNWTQQAYLKASNTGTNCEFGRVVAVSANTVVVGAHGEKSAATGVNGNQSDLSAPGSGAAYVFIRDGTNWTQQAYLKASNSEIYDNFGISVSVWGDTVIVGARFEDSSATGVNGNQHDQSASGSGAAYVFVRNGTNWSQQAYLKASNTGTGDWFGGAVGVEGDTAVVGAMWEGSSSTGVNGNQGDNSSISSGAAYVFVRNGTNWTQQAYLKASNTHTDDRFGNSVAVAGGTVVVGAYQEYSNATGVNGNPHGGHATHAGAAYVFVRDGTNWSQQAYLKASNTKVGDWFGFSAAISGDTVVIGASMEDGGSSGVNGDASDFSNGQSGAAYVFTGLGVGPRLTLAPDGEGGFFVRFTGVPDVSYRVQRATSLGGPWDTVATLIAPASGLLEFHDANAPPAQAFYRTAQP